MRIVFVGAFVSKRWIEIVGRRFMRLVSRWSVVAVLACGTLAAQGPKTITVGAAGADFTTIQAAVTAAPEAGAVIKIQPGVYREVVHVDKPQIEFRGEGDDWTKV